MHFDKGTRCSLIAYTNTSGINAYDLVRACRPFGISVLTTDKRPISPIPVAWQIQSCSWLLFTEEKSLRAAIVNPLKHKFWPKQFDLNLLDDKYEFANWLSLQDLGISGLTQCSMAERRNLWYPYLVKAKHSWFGGRKMPRGWICRSEDDMHRALNCIQQQGLQQDLFFLQEWLGNSTVRVVSVCGYHDHGNARRNLTATVERVSAHTNGLSCSAVVHTIGDSWGFVPKTQRILDRLRYTGPYELEFLVTPDRQIVLELNPRFWMQHAIFAADGNGVLRRYFGLDTLRDHAQSTIRNTAWFDGVHLLVSTLTLRLTPLCLYMKWRRRTGLRVVVSPPFHVAAVCLARIAWRKIQRLMRASYRGIVQDGHG